MRKHIFPKSGIGVMISLLIPLSTVQASDANDRIQAYLGEGGAAYTQWASLPDPTWSSQGPQGPIRMDMTEDKPTASETAATAQETNYRDFPHPDGG